MRVSVEYAHSRIDLVDQGEMIRSVKAAQAVVGACTDLGHTVTTVALIDDKHVTRTEATTMVPSFLRLLAESGLEPQTCYFESDLLGFLGELRELLPTVRLQRALDRNIRNYRAKSKPSAEYLPCSVDIALWHSLRLGMFSDQPLPISDIAVSVLGHANLEYECLARQDYLRHLPYNASGRVIDVYYPDSLGRPFDPGSVAADLLHNLKGPETCPPS
jgi:hypothetical protein